MLLKEERYGLIAYSCRLSYQVCGYDRLLTWSPWEDRL